MVLPINHRTCYIAPYYYQLEMKPTEQKAILIIFQPNVQLHYSEFSFQQLSIYRKGDIQQKLERMPAVLANLSEQGLIPPSYSSFITHETKQKAQILNIANQCKTIPDSINHKIIQKLTKCQSIQLIHDFTNKERSLFFFEANGNVLYHKQSDVDTILGILENNYFSNDKDFPFSAIHELLLLQGGFMCNHYAQGNRELDYRHSPHHPLLFFINGFYQDLNFACYTRLGGRTTTKPLQEITLSFVIDFLRCIGSISTLNIEKFLQSKFPVNKPNFHCFEYLQDPALVDIDQEMALPNLSSI